MAQYSQLNGPQEDLDNDHDHDQDHGEASEAFAKPYASGEHVQHPYFKTSSALHTAISCAAGTVMLLFGYEQGVFGGIIVGEDFIEYFNNPSPAMQGFVTSVYDLGCFVGAILTLFIGEKLGRRWTMIVGTIVMGSGIIVQTASHNMTTMIWGRFIAGIGNGANTSTAPVWHVETSHDDQKSIAVVKEMSVNVLGFVISNFVTLACSELLTEVQWRFPLGVQLVFVVIILAMIHILPESPRWLLARKREDEAKEVLRMLNDHDINEEFEEIKVSIKAEQATQASWAQIFQGGLTTRRVSLGVALQFMQQVGGINLLCYYLPVVLHRSVGLPEKTARLVAALNSVAFFLSTTGSITFVGKVGRRPLLMFGAAAMSLTMLAISINIGLGLAMPGNHSPGIAAVVFIWLFFTAFSFGWISVPWSYSAEVNSLSVRSKGAALASAADWIANGAVVMATPPGIHHLTWGFYLIFAILNAIWVPLVYYFLVETKGRSLEDTDRWFQANPGWLVHKADHSAGKSQNGTNGLKLDTLRRAEDQQAMMGDFELGSDDDDDDDSPVTRRASFPHIER